MQVDEDALLPRVINSLKEESSRDLLRREQLYVGPERRNLRLRPG